MTSTIKTSAPGSLMIMGEHAVLRGKGAIVTAINKRVFVSLEPRSDTQIIIESDILGRHQTSLDQLRLHPPFTFVLQAILSLKPYLKTGFTLHITSEFSDKIGYGSSGAVVIATLGALVKWLALPILPESLFSRAKECVEHIQGLGSGADLAASLWGGTLFFQLLTQPVRLPLFPAFTAVYCGFKTTTPEVVSHVNALFKPFPEFLDAIDRAIDQCVSETIPAIQHQEWDKVGALMNMHHELQSAYGVSLPQLDDLAWRLRQDPGIKGVKISGSGLGDCLIALGHPSQDLSISHLPNAWIDWETTAEQKGLIDEQE